MSGDTMRTSEIVKFMSSTERKNTLLNILVAESPSMVLEVITQAFIQRTDRDPRDEIVYTSAIIKLRQIVADFRGRQL